MVMRAENFICFFTVCGFFCGIIFSLLKAADPLEILMFTLIITLAFYLLVHVAVMNFIDVKQAGKKLFDQEQYEEISAYFIHELQDREIRMESLIDTNATHEGNVIHNFMEKDGVPKKKAA